MLASTTLNLASFGSQLLNSPSHNPTKPFLLPPNQPFLKSPNPISSSSSSFLKSRTTSVRTAVAAVDSSDAAVKEGGEGGSKSYHFVVANAKFMLDEEEHFQELMGERLRLYGERNMEQDFWLVIEPKFLDKFPTITKRLNRPAVALVSTNGPWITKTMDGGAAAAIEVLVQTLINVSKEEISLIRGLDNDVKQLKKTLGMIQSYLNDAEKKVITQEAVKNWLRELETLAFRADNVLDEFNYHLLHHKIKTSKNVVVVVGIMCYTCYEYMLSNTGLRRQWWLVT